MKKYLLPVLILFVIAGLNTTQSKAQAPLLLYGMASEGGTWNQGVLFQTNPAGSEIVLHSFGSGTDGQMPLGSLIQASNGLLYGMTEAGGAYGGGIIFSYNIATNTETDIYDFGNDTDGARPEGKLIEATNGLLYGMTYGGGVNSDGIIFSFNSLTNKETALHEFGNTGDGGGPEGSLVQAKDSLLYGVTLFGGNGAYGPGIIFSYNISKNAYTNLYDFGNGNNDAAYPEGTLIQASDTNLYGMSKVGGANYLGAIFSYTISTGTESTVYSFGSVTNDGVAPHGSLVQAGNHLLYGMTSSGGANNQGIIFSFNSSTETETDVHDFGSGTDGVDPFGDLIQASDSLLYGMVLDSGVYDDGIIYSFNALNNTETDIHDFDSADGASPYGNLLQADSNIALSPPQSLLVCNGRSVILMVSGGTIYTWKPSSGLSATTGDSVVASPSATTTYTVTSERNGYSATDTDVVTIIASPNQPTFYQHGDTLISSSTYDNQWYRNDTLLSDTSQYLIITETGEYLVVVNNEANGCSTASDSINITTVTGVEQLIAESGQLTIYPNPFSNIIFIKINSSAIINDWNLMVTDVLGRTFFVKTSLHYSNEIDLSKLSNGVYFITVVNKGERAVFPLVKQN